MDALLSHKLLHVVESVPLPGELAWDRVYTHKFLVEISSIVPERDNPPLKDVVCVSRPCFIFGLPPWEIVEEEAKSVSRREVRQVPSVKIHIDFHCADRLHFQSSDLPWILATLISDKFHRIIDKINVAVADNQEC